MTALETDRPSPSAVDRFALFQTPVVVYRVPDMSEIDPELRDRLVAESRASPGFQRSNVGGWHSVPDLSQRREDCYRALMERVVRYVGTTFKEVAAMARVAPEARYRYAIHGWAMVMGAGDYTILHDHAEAHWSVVYYADAGDSDHDAHPMSGQISFVDPRRGGHAIPGADIFPSTFSVKPQTGNMIVFPGWLQHYVHPYRGARPRVCVSCNVKMDPVGPA